MSKDKISTQEIAELLSLKAGISKKAADDFIKFITSDAAKAVFDSYYFDTNVE